MPREHLTDPIEEKRVSKDGHPSKREQPLEGEQSFDFERWLSVDFERQYTEKAKILNENGLLEYLPDSQDIGIVGIDGKEYPFPKMEEIKEALRENHEIYTEKMKQGFTEIEITPFAMPLDRLIEAAKAAIIRHHEDGKLFTAKKNQDDENKELEPLPLKKGEDGKYEPIWAWDEYEHADIDGSMVYDPKEFSKDNHQGKTKQEMLDMLKNTPFPGYLVTLVEKNVNIPRNGKGKTLSGRKQLEVDKSANNYLKTLQTNQEYMHESGQTPEDWLVHFLTHLERTNQVIDDWQGNGSTCLNVASYFPASGVVPYAYWRRSYRQAYLYRYHPAYSNLSMGFRSRVRVFGV